MRKAQASLHRLARATRDMDEEDPSASWSSDDEAARPSTKRRAPRDLYEEYDSSDEAERDRHRSRRNAAPAPLRGPARFEDSALGLAGRRHLFPEKVDEIVAHNAKSRAIPNPKELRPFAPPLNDGTYYDEANNYSGAFSDAWIQDIVTRATMLQKNLFYNFLSILATRLQVDIEETFDVDALDRIVMQTKENLQRRELDAKRTLVTLEAKETQLALMRELRWRERVEHDVAQMRYRQMMSYRPLAEVANALYAKCKMHLDADKKTEPVLTARPGVHVIDELLHDFRLFYLIYEAERGGRGANMVRLARSVDNRALAARSPLYKQLVAWFAYKPGAVVPEGNEAQWIFTQPALRAQFRGIFLLVYFYLDHDVLRHTDKKTRSPYQPPLQYVHAAYRWVWERMLQIAPELQDGQEDYLEARTFWMRMHTPLDTAQRAREIKGEHIAAIQKQNTLRELWDWLDSQDADPLADLRPDANGRFAILERLDINLGRTREVSIDHIHERMLVKPHHTDHLARALQMLAAELAKETVVHDETLDSLKAKLSPSDRDLIERLENQTNSPILEQTDPTATAVSETGVGTLTDDAKKTIRGEFPKLTAREADLARSTFPFSFVNDPLLHEHLYYVTTDRAARKDRVVPRTQLSVREDHDAARQDAEESPKSRIQRVYARANLRALAAISGFGAYIPAKEGEPMYAYTIQQDATLLPAVLLAETFAVRLYQVEHAAARLDEYNADILEIEGIIANIATERPALPDRDQILRRYVAPSRKSVQWRMRPEISGQITVNPTIRSLIESTMFYVRNANPALGEFDMEDLLREENADFMLGFIDCVVATRNMDQLSNPVAFSATITVGNVKQSTRAAFQRMKLFRRGNVLKRDVAPPTYVPRFYYMRTHTTGMLGYPLSPRPFG